nr:IP13327p [Drosophila melanogaster]
MTGKYHPAHAKLRRCKSTPSLNCDGMAEPMEEDQLHRFAACSRNPAAEAQQHAQPSCNSSSSSSDGSCNSNKCSSNICGAQPTTPESLRFGCAHYKRRAMFVTPCCNKFYKCRFCHDENETHHFDRKTLTELICSECNTRQTVREQCLNCGVRFGKYTCLICNLFDDADKQQYHCHGCGICRIGGAENFFHCEVCNMCLPIQLKIDGHRCVENISRSHCPVCLGDIHTSRIPCHIPDCGHLLHKMCFDQLLASGHYTCPTCQTSLIDMTALWVYLDDQAERMPVPLKYENQRVHIFCNDCHKTSKTKFHFIGLKCVHCGAYNTTQDVKRRLSLVTDEPSSA